MTLTQSELEFPEMACSELAAESLLRSLHGKEFSAVLADPPWRFLWKED